MNPLIQSLTESQLRTDIPNFRPGDTVRVHAKVVEGNRERVQIRKSSYKSLTVYAHNERTAKIV